tara:strand:+ start:279 stop:743 length:465 start_codon:yes stop_codon:yes gene_type:complete
MPNHCSNRVEIYSDNKILLDEIRMNLKGEDTEFDFNKILPQPDWKKTPITGEETSWLGSEEKLGEVGELPNEEGIFESTGKHDQRWYDWNISNWDTKWNSFDVDTTHDDDCLMYYFTTAWSPPEAVILALREMYPDTSITAFYDEPGVGIAGYL